MNSAHLGAALTGIAAVAAFAGSGAAAAPLQLTASPVIEKQIVRVHGDWDEDDYDDERRHWRRHHRGHHVDAPYTHVESGRRVVVDAPFAHVYVGRNGRRVVAPFVDLWVPRGRN